MRLFPFTIPWPFSALPVVKNPETNIVSVSVNFPCISVKIPREMSFFYVSSYSRRRASSCIGPFAIQIRYYYTRGAGGPFELVRSIRWNYIATRQISPIGLSQHFGFRNRSHRFWNHLRREFQFSRRVPLAGTFEHFRFFLPAAAASNSRCA